MDRFKTAYIPLCALMLFVVSCSGGDNGEDILGTTEYLNVTSVVSLPGDGSAPATLEIKADCSWAITGDPSWLTLSDKSGKGDASITVSATPNPSSTDERSAAITVASTSGKIKRTVTISQAISAETLSVSTDAISFVSEGESKILSITSNSAWRITGAEDWLSLSRQEGTGNSDITIAAQKNPGETQRKAMLTVQCTNVSVRVAIAQDGHVTTLSVSPSAINANCIEGSYELTLDGDASWTASVDVDWCSLSKLTGTGSDKLTVSVATNTNDKEREAKITFSTSQGDKTCIVRQFGGSLPTISGFKISEVGRYSFTASASYASEYDVVEYGVCYSETAAEPTIANSIISQEVASKTGNITLVVNGLNSGRTYYVRTYAVSLIGITYSEVKTATTTGSTPSNDDNVKPQI